MESAAERNVLADAADFLQILQIALLRAEMVKLRSHLLSHGHRYRRLAYSRWSIEQKRASIRIGCKLRQDALGFGQPDKFRYLARAILFTQANGESKSRGGHWPPPCNGSVWEI